MKKLLAVIIWIPSLANAPDRTPESIWNKFAEDANTWTKLVEARQPGVYNVKELHAWKQLKEDWGEVKRTFDPLY